MKKLFLPSFSILVATLLVALATGCGGETKSDVDLQAKIQALDTGDAGAKQDALAAIATMKEAAAPAVPKLTEMLKDPDSLVQQLAAYALGEVGPKAKSAVPALRDCMRGAKASTVMTAALNAIRSIDPDSPEAKADIPNVQAP